MGGLPRNRDAARGNLRPVPWPVTFLLPPSCRFHPTYLCFQQLFKIARGFRVNLSSRINESRNYYAIIVADL